MAIKPKKEKEAKIEKPKVDLFLALDKINSNDIEFFNKLTDEEKKSLAPIVVMRFLSGVRDKKQINHLNHLINPLVFILYKHPDLLFKLMMASCTDGSKRFKWIKKNGGMSKYPLSMDILERYYRCSISEAKQYFPLHSKDDIIEMANALGEDKSLIDKLKKE